MPDANSEAVAVLVGVENVQLTQASDNLPAKVNIIATYDPGKTSVVDEVPVQIINAEDAGTRFGFGWPVHRLAIQVFAGSQGSGEVWVTPQTETGTAADGEIAWTGTTTAAGTIFLRIGFELYAIPIAITQTIEQISDAVVAFVNAVTNTPVIAAKTAVTFETTFTSKAKGLEQDNIPITLNYGIDEELPAGITGAVITDMTNGAGTPDIDDALNGTGIGDGANAKFFTDMVHGYGLDTATLDKVSAYVGLGNVFVGTYKQIVSRPFTSINVDIDPGSAALTALIAITDARLTDRGNLIYGVPTSTSIPTEIAALITGTVARIAQGNPPQTYKNQVLQGVDPGVSTDRWTDDYDTGRDLAAKKGISPTFVVSSEVRLQNSITLYRPTNVPPASNGYKNLTSIKKLANMMFHTRRTFEGSAYDGIYIVNDVANVTDNTAKQKAMDVLTVKTDVNNLATFFEGKALIFDADFMQANSTVVIRAASNGFDIVMVFKLSAEGNILSITQRFDANIA